MNTDQALTGVAAIDIVILLLIVWGGYRGFQKGFLVELLMTVVFIVSVLAFFKIVQMGFDTTQEYSDDKQPFAKSFPFFTLLIAYAVITLGINLLGKAVSGMMPVVFEGFDRFLGAGLGVLKYLLSFGILFKLLVTVGVFEHEQIRNATIFYPIIADVFDGAIEIGGKIAPFIKDLVGDITRLLQQNG